MRKMNHRFFCAFTLLNVFLIQAQVKDYSSLKKSFIQWENSKDSLKDYFNYLNDSEIILKGKDISFLNEQYADLSNLIGNVDRFSLDGANESNSHEDFQSQYLFLRIKSLEVFLDFALVCKNNTKVFKVLNESSVSFLRAEGDFYNDAKFFLNEAYVNDLINEWNELVAENTEVVLEDIKSTNFYNEFLKSEYIQEVGVEVFRTRVKERKQTNYRYRIDEFKDGFIDTSSRLISNLFGFFGIRKGKLYKDEDFLIDVETNLQPLDILLEKTPFRLTDKIIPGYWSHAAVYVGNENELKELGIWEHPLVIPHHDLIRKGACIIEALRSNVAINSFASFSNVDAYAQLRLKEELNTAQKQTMLLTVFAQIGKEYDFRFNVESSDKMVCTEIHYLAYEMLQFHPKLNLGAYSVSVDDLAVQGAKNSLLKPIKLYVDGDKVERDIQTYYDRLISGKIKEIASIN